MLRTEARGMGAFPGRFWLGAVAVMIACGGWWERCEGAGVRPALLMAPALLGSQPRLVLLPAATRVGDAPPKGWTHIVMRTVPRLASGDRDTLPDSATETAALFRTVVLADVQSLGLDQQFILTRVGLGLCVPARDGTKDEIVVASDRLEALSMKLSTVEKIVLDAAETEMAEARLVARSSSFALLRSPATMVVQGKHCKVDLFYAFCVDPMTGELRVGAWSMWPGTVKQPPPPNVVALAPKTVFDCGLDVHAKRILGTVPYSWSFAIRGLPPGKKIQISKPLGEKIVAVTRRPIDVDPEVLDAMLRKTLFGHDRTAEAKRSRGESVRR